MREKERRKRRKGEKRKEEKEGGREWEKKREREKGKDKEKKKKKRRGGEGWERERERATGVCPKWMRHYSTLTRYKRCNTHETCANTALLYTTQSNGTQTISLAVGADGKTQTQTCAMPNSTTTLKDPPSTQPIKLDPPLLLESSQQQTKCKTTGRQVRF